MSSERSIVIGSFETNRPDYYVEVSVYHSKPRRQYRVRALPMQRGPGDIVSYGLFDGLVAKIEDAPRFSAKRLASLADERRGERARILAVQAARNHKLEVV